MRIVAIGAHLDDIELACGGTLARAVQAGHQVKMICLTGSAYTNYDGRVLRTQEVAVEEGRVAASLLGVGDFEILDFPTKDVPYDSRTVEAIDRRISEFQPDTIFTHWPFDTHQAHRASSLSTISAARRFNTIFLYEPIPPSGRSYVAFRPQLYVDITPFQEVKEASLRAHRSQYEKYGEEWIEAVRGRALLRGFEMGTKYAEAFEVVRMELKF